MSASFPKKRFCSFFISSTAAYSLGRQMVVNYEHSQHFSGMTAIHASLGFIKNGWYSDGFEKCIKTLLKVC